MVGSHNEHRSPAEITAILAALTVGGSVVLRDDEYEPAAMLHAEIASGHRYVADPTGATAIRIVCWA